MNKTYLHIRRRQPRIRHNRRTTIQHLAFIPSLLTQLPNGCLLRRLPLIDQSCWELNTKPLDWRSILQDYDSGKWSGRVPEDGGDGDGVDARFAPCGA